LQFFLTLGNLPLQRRRRLLCFFTELAGCLTISSAQRVLQGIPALMRGRVLVVDHRTPRPDQDSGSASTFSYLQILAGSGLGVTFAPFNLVNDGRYTQSIRNLGIETLEAPRWQSMTAVIEAYGPQCDILLLYRAPVATHLLDLARRAAPAAKILFHPVDLHFLRMQREAALTGGRPEAASAQTMRATELELIERADATIVVSSYEARLLQGLVPGAAVHHIPILRETPSKQIDSTFEERRDFLFIGGYEHPPNVDAVRWFVRDAWPKLHSRGFTGRFIIAGSKMPDEIRALAAAKIDVRGYVEDLASLFAACRLSIAPLRYGGGIKGKIVTSLSYGLPVVASSIAAEGMGLQHGENIIIADDADQVADQIMRLYHDAELWQRLSVDGYHAFRDKFSLAAGTDAVLAVFNGLLGTGRP
jgi:O-antigen biosynthesis protein